VLRRDVGGRQLLVGVSSGTVALAMRHEQQRPHRSRPRSHKAGECSRATLVTVSDPDWTASPVAAELEGVVTRMRRAREVARHVTLMGLLDSWRGLVEQVEHGYEESVYEYANDVDSRKILDRVAADAPREAGEALRAWLRPWDDRYDRATRRASAPFHGDAEAESVDAASPWHCRIPLRLVGDLKSDLRDMGLA
jgi:hypothetical protein